MSEENKKTAKKRVEQGVKLRGADKVDRIPVKVIPTEKSDMPRKPDWLRVRMGSNADKEKKRKE
jgi:lipoic acid synthetase